jgi:ATP-dependent DNA helicase RecQ
MIKQKLNEYFKFETFKPGQEEIVTSLLQKKDVVAIMPTGGGKSLCYQLPAVINENLTIVISPLIALMKDQVDSLKVRKIKAEFINSSQTFNEIQSIIQQIKKQQLRILYVAPERLKNFEFQNLFNDISVDLIAVDEAHCVSAWGHDFRSDYLKIKDFIAQFNNRPTVAAFTATATPEVKDDIIKHLQLQQPKVFVRGYDRPNLRFFVQANLIAKQRPQIALDLIKKLAGSGIVYTLTRNSTQEIADFFNEKGVTARAYHAGMDSHSRSQVQDLFMENKIKIIVATVAFGMGVNKADIRFVIHLGMPASLENYYQETGRAGRDGELSHCILLSSKKDFALQSFFVKKSQEEMIKQGYGFQQIKYFLDIKYQKISKMKEYTNSKNCRRRIILNYFSDPDINKYSDNCGNCDICLNYTWSGQSQATAQKTNIKVLKTVDKEISSTVQETIKLYNENYTLAEIAKMRDLGVSTILNHLTRWYAGGGDLDLKKFITREQEALILQAMSKSDDYTKLSPIKAKLPNSISYEQIRLVIAKIQRIKL